MDGETLDPGCSRILVVDDEPSIQSLISRLLGRMGHDAIPALTGAEALSRLDTTIDLVYLDFGLPDLDGHEVARRIRARPGFAALPIIMITGHHDRDVRLGALAAGATDFLAKPFDATELQLRTRTHLQLKRLLDASERQSQTLAGMVQQRTAALDHALRRLEGQRDELHHAHLETLERLALAAEYRDDDTASHIRRVSRLSVLLGRKLGCPVGQLDLLEHASALHDVGKIGVPDAILMKPGKLTDDERRTMQGHCEIGSRILAGSRSEVLRAAEQVALTHHEWWSGGGYPRGLAGKAIPLSGRLVAVADVFDALTHARPYKKAFPTHEALAIMTTGRGVQFDPDAVDALLGSLPEVLTVMRVDWAGSTGAFTGVDHFLAEGHPAPHRLPAGPGHDPDEDPGPADAGAAMTVAPLAQVRSVAPGAFLPGSDPEACNPSSGGS